MALQLSALLLLLILQLLLVECYSQHTCLKALLIFFKKFKIRTILVLFIFCFFESFHYFFNQICLLCCNEVMRLIIIYCLFKPLMSQIQIYIKNIVLCFSGFVASQKCSILNAIVNTYILLRSHRIIYLVLNAKNASSSKQQFINELLLLQHTHRIFIRKVFTIILWCKCLNL